MSEMGKTHIVIQWTVGPDAVAEGDRVFEKHAKWMTGHDRKGDTALRRYNISKGPELSNPLDPSSSPTGDTIFVLSEIYESPAGVDEYWTFASVLRRCAPAYLALCVAMAMTDPTSAQDVINNSSTTIEIVLMSRAFDCAIWSICRR